MAIGELLVDMISNEYGDHLGSDGYTRFVGGAPSNIAMNVNRLGIRSHIVSAVGEDGFGTFLLNRLNEAGMDTRGFGALMKRQAWLLLAKARVHLSRFSIGRLIFNYHLMQLSRNGFAIPKSFISLAGRYLANLPEKPLKRLLLKQGSTVY